MMIGVISSARLGVILACTAGVMLGGCSASSTPGTGAAANATPDQPNYDCRPAKGTITIDGVLDEPAWQDAPFSDLFLVSAPGVREMPDRLATRMKMLYDRDNLYAAFDCEDSDIWATYASRDDPVRFEKAVLLDIDPLGNGRGHYGFQVNPLNALLDCKTTGGASKLNPKRWRQAVEWNATGVEHAVHVEGTINKRDDTDNRWTVEPKIRFDDLGVRPLPGDVWHVRADRLDYWVGRTVFSSWARAEFGTVVFK